MANAAIVIDNLADGKTVVASSQALTMPASNLLTPHPQERWRSVTGADYFILDKGADGVPVTVTINNQSGATTGTALTAIDETAAIPNLTTVAKIGIYQTAAKTVTLKIAQKNSPGNYDIVISQSFSHPGGGWADLTLASAYVVPASGSYYVGAWSSGASDTVAGAVVGAYVLATDVTGSGQVFTEHPSGGTWALRYTIGSSAADTVMVGGLTCGSGATVRLRLSTIDATGVAGDVLDTGLLSTGNAHFDITYASFIWRLVAPASYRYVRFDIVDPAKTYVEAGYILDGLSEVFAYNFSWSAGFQHHDRSGVVKVAGGGTLTWQDNTYRSISLPFGWVTSAQRYGVIERLDRVKGKTSNILLMTDTASTNMPRDSIYGLVTDQTQIGFVQGVGLFTKALNIEERI